MSEVRPEEDDQAPFRPEDDEDHSLPSDHSAAVFQPSAEPAWQDQRPSRVDDESDLARFRPEEPDIFVPAPAEPAARALPELAVVDPRPPVPGPAHGGLDGPEIEAGVSGYLDFLSALCRELGVPDPVEEYFAPVVGRWSELHDEAGRWRSVGAVAGTVAADLTTPLGGLDAAWEGADADSFIEYMGRVGLAGRDMSDAMITMGEVLDTAADGVREMVHDLADVLAETAETAALALRGSGTDRATRYLDHMRAPTRELFEAVRQVLEAVVRLCEGVDASAAFAPVAMPHTFPEDNWAFQPEPVATPDVRETGLVDTGSAPAADHPDAPKGGGGYAGGGGGGAPTESVRPPQPGGYVTTGEAIPGKPGGMPEGGAAPAAASAGGGRGGFGGMPMMPMGGMGGANAGGTEHKSRSRVTGKPADIFGKPQKTSPSVIGDD